MHDREPVAVEVSQDLTLPGLLLRPKRVGSVLVLAHGAGAGMEHAHMERLGSALAEAGCATLRFEFPYRLRGRRLPGRMDENVLAFRAAVRTASAFSERGPLFAGGHSYGGRVASHAALDDGLPEVVGLAFFSFPLHPARRPDSRRAAHLGHIGLPMLFVSGRRDTLATHDLLEAVTAPLEMTTVRWLDQADHGYLRPRTFSGPDAYESAARSFAIWAASLAQSRRTP